jgi:hypothetical protein
MSVELDLVCHDCKKAIWGGCDGMSGHQFLYANPAEMKALGLFLYAHMGHRLEYCEDQRHEDYEQVRPLEQLSDSIPGDA